MGGFVLWLQFRDGAMEFIALGGTGNTIYMADTQIPKSLLEVD